jgi:hypothetical protein
VRAAGTAALVAWCLGSSDGVTQVQLLGFLGLTFVV